MDENNIAKVAAVLGGIALLGNFCCCVPLINYLAMVVVPFCALGAIITGFLGMQKANELGGEGKEMAIAGLAMGALTIVIDIGLVALSVFGMFGLILLDSM